MDILKVDLEYCYGIKKLKFQFDFSQRKAHVIYAPNGAMKSSFARVFEDRINKIVPSDLINPSNHTKCNLKDQNDSEIVADNILVIGPSNPRYDSRKGQSSLLVDEAQKKEYSDILDSLEQSKKDFIKKVSKYSGSPKKIEELFTNAFGKVPKSFFECLGLIKDEVVGGFVVDFSDIEYLDIFNTDVMDFLKKDGVIAQIADYVGEYNKLIDQSLYFKRDAFDHNNATIVCESLNKNGFFKANHSVSLRSTTGEISPAENINEMERLFQAEKERIHSNKDLEKRFNELDNIISNAKLKTFRAVIEKHKELLLKIDNIGDLKKSFWVSYFVKEKDVYTSLLALYEASAERLKQIEGEALSQFTTWQEVVSIFKERFDVPFEVKISNQDDVILRGVLPEISFRHFDTLIGSSVERELLLKVLSTGELRALYILNVIFEIKARSHNASTLIIVDDIADSFDYKNKYAIVEYLNDILDEPNFRAIILTHNFDFFRTLESRLNVNRYDSCHVVVKSDTEVKLVRAKECLDIFSEWKKELNNPNCINRNKIIISAIPFVRNLIEYTYGMNTEYNTLTSLLHMKSDSVQITINQLVSIYNSFWKTNISPNVNDNVSVLDILFSLAEDCLLAPEGVNLENKLILSVSIRLKTEKYIIGRINDSNFVATLGNYQTAKLIKKYKQTINDENNTILDKVNIMTPENIHFNSFMYEPILDMSDSHLKNLYIKVKRLQSIADV